MTIVAEAQERSARVVLAAVAEPSDGAINHHIEARGAAVVVDELRTGTSPLRRADTYAARMATVDVQRIAADTERARARVLVPGETGWPSGLDDLGDRRPFALWVRGPLDFAECAQRPAVSIVGARASTHYGDGVAVEFSADLARAGWTVVSGGAYGIDAAAHRGALAVDGATIAVLANGVDLAYPRGNEALLNRIAEEGAIVTELPPGRTPTRSGFLARNRLIAALGTVTLVVEAALRSGSATTVARAVELGRDVCGVPGPITSAMSVGVHALIRDGAVMVTEPTQVRELVGPLQLDLHEGGAQQADTARDLLGPDDRALLDAFPARRAVAAEDLAVRVGLGFGRVVQRLGSLEGEGWIQRGEGGTYRLMDRARAR